MHGCCYRGKLKAKIRCGLHDREGINDFHKDETPLKARKEPHAVDLGSGYKNDQACATFMEFIALEQKERLQAVFRETNVF